MQMCSIKRNKQEKDAVGGVEVETQMWVMLVDTLKRKDKWSMGGQLNPHLIVTLWLMGQWMKEEKMK